MASVKSDLDSVGALIKDGCQVDARNGYGETPLWLAAGYSADPRVSQALISSNLFLRKTK